MGEHSLLLQDGGDHQRARKLLMPAFNGQALKSYEGLVERVARAEVDRWRSGETFAALERMNALTLEVILHVVFGVTDEDRLAALRPRVKATVEVGPAVVLGWGFRRCGASARGAGRSTTPASWTASSTARSTIAVRPPTCTTAPTSSPA
jgi:cytochrome P450